MPSSTCYLVTCRVAAKSTHIPEPPSSRPVTKSHPRYSLRDLRIFDWTYRRLKHIADLLFTDVR